LQAAVDLFTFALELARRHASVPRTISGDADVPTLSPHCGAPSESQLLSHVLERYMGAGHGARGPSLARRSNKVRRLLIAGQSNAAAEAFVDADSLDAMF
jgi:hypothetical protein